VAHLASRAVEQHLSDTAKAARQSVRDAAAQYQAVVEELIDDPTGQIVERLRHVEEQVSDAALRWALAYAEGAEPR